MITIPLNTNSGIRIPAWQVEPKAERKRTENTERIGVSIQEAAKMFGISRPHFYPLVKEGKIRTIKIGRRVLVSVQSLRDFVDGKKEPCNSVENSDESQDKSE
jgi:excisionase family DNA binding protein